MIRSGWRCLSAAQLDVDVLLVAVSVVLVAGFAVLARRHLAAGRIWRARGMIAAVIASGAMVVLWGTCSILGVPPFWVGAMRLPPCDAVQGTGNVHAPSRPVDGRDGLTPT